MQDRIIKKNAGNIRKRRIKVMGRFCVDNFGLIGIKNCKNGQVTIS